MNDNERFFFDLNGYLVVENALDSREVDACNESIDNQREERVVNWSSTSLRIYGADQLIKG